MKARVLEAQADLFEVGVLSQSARVLPVSMDRLLSAPSGAPLVIIGSLLQAKILDDIRMLTPTLGSARTPIIVVPPFTDLDLGRYFETPVQLHAQRRDTESTARILDTASAETLGDQLAVRSDHFLDTALGAGVVAVDSRGKPVLIRYQATNNSPPVFFSALQLLSYTALTNEEQRQALLTHLLSWTPALVPGEIGAASRTPPSDSPGAPRGNMVSEDKLVSVALLIAAGGPQSEDQLLARAQALLGVDLNNDDLRGALETLNRQALIETEAAQPIARSTLIRFLEQHGMHPYLRELTDMLGSEEELP